MSRRRAMTRTRQGYFVRSTSPAGEGARSACRSPSFPPARIHWFIASAPARNPVAPPRRCTALRILAIHAGMHELLGGRVRRLRDGRGGVRGAHDARQGLGEQVPWLSVDEVLRSRAGRARDVDAIATMRGWFSTHDYKFRSGASCITRSSAGSGRERTHRELAVLSHRFGVTDTHSFRADRFLRDNSFRPDTPIYLANHHAGHALASLSHRLERRARLYVGRHRRQCQLFDARPEERRADCFYGDDRWPTKTLKETGLASAYGYATVACGFACCATRESSRLAATASRSSPARWRRVPLQRRQRADGDGFPQLVRDARDFLRSARATTARPSRPRSRRWRKISPCSR